jgi:hypothetical protein
MAAPQRCTEGLCAAAEKCNRGLVYLTYSLYVAKTPFCRYGTDFECRSSILHGGSILVALRCRKVKVLRFRVDRCDIGRLHRS